MSRNVFPILVALSLAIGFALSLHTPEDVVLAVENAEYIGNAQCKVCHNAKADGAQWDVWHSLKHASAYKLLESDEAKAAGEAAGLTKPPAESPECLKCHVSGYDATAGTFHAKLAKADGVQCESCHGPGSLHAQDGKTLKFKPAEAANIDVKANLAVITESTCLACHNDSSPTWKNDRYTLENGEKVGFDFEQAKKKIAHPNPKKAAN